MYRQHYPDDPGLHNMEDNASYTRTTYRRNPSFCERVKASLFAVILGIGLVCTSCGLLYWNEGRAVQTAKSLDEGLKSVRSLQTTEVAFDENNGHLVHLMGPLRTSKVLHDADYKLAVNAIKLRRHVEIYQWVEHESKKEVKEGDSTRTETSYSYSQEWRSSLIDSSSFYNKFGHDNPRDNRISAQTYIAKDAQVGNFFLSEAMINKIDNFRRIAVAEAPANAILNGDEVYHGSDPNRPVIGDVRVYFDYAGRSGKDTSQLGPPDMVSVIAKQHGSSVESYQTEAGDKLEMLYMGEYTAQKMFANEKMQNATLTWGLRFVGWLLMFIGFGCTSRIFITLVDWIPIVRDIISLGVTLMNVTLAISLSLTVIALGWIRYRPWLGCSILALAAVPFIINKLRPQQRSRSWQRSQRSFID